MGPAFGPAQGMSLSHSWDIKQVNNYWNKMLSGLFVVKQAGGVEESGFQGHREEALELNDENSWVKVWDKSSMRRKEQGPGQGGWSVRSG